MRVEAVPVAVPYIQPAAPPPPEAPVEFAPGTWEPPPVRRGGGEPLPPAVAETTAGTAQGARRRNKLFMAVIVLGVLAVAAGAGLFLWRLRSQSEGYLGEEAQKAYDAGLYATAKEKWLNLVERFPESPRHHEYQFLADLARIRADLGGLGPDVPAMLAKVEEFLRTYDGDPLLSDHGRDLGESLFKMLDEFAEQARGKGDSLDPATEDTLRAAEQALETARKAVPAAVTPAEQDRLKEAFEGVRVLARNAKERRDTLVRVAGKGADPVTPRVIRDARDQIERAGLGGDREAQQILEGLYRRALEQVKYTDEPIKLPPVPGDTSRSIIITPRTVGVSAVAPDDDRIVLALARGVLYGLAQTTGDIRWALRVGVDTATLPVRVPATAANPELFLVMSADTRTMSAVDSGGREVWRYRLSAPCLGRPVVLQRERAWVAFVPTLDGRVHEIELAAGKLKGRYDVGQPLTVGGAHQAGTDRIYFPAADSCVFVLNVGTRKCEQILYTDHPSGSLRSEPIVVSWTEKDAYGQPLPRGYLFLSQTSGVDAMQLKAYELPLADRKAPALAMNPEPRMHGWTWFAPYHDPEKLALVSDAGMLGLFGVRQAKTHDNPLFLMVPAEPGKKGLGIDLDPFLLPEARQRGRAQLAHSAEDNNFWVLARGKLQRLRVVLNPNAGPKVFPVWPAPLALGSPLHASQVFDQAFEADAPPGTHLLVVTQALGQDACLATAVDAEDGRIRWQRQLGMVCRGEPLVFGGHVLTLDQSGGLFAFDASKYKTPEGHWMTGGKSLAHALDDGRLLPPALLRGPGGTAYEIACPGKGEQLVIRRYTSGEEGLEPKVEDVDPPYDLRGKAPVGGAPSVGAGGVLVPLANGSTLRFDLDGKFLGDGPNWRPDSANWDVRPHAVWLSAEEFLLTDGARGLLRFYWPNDKKKTWLAVPDKGGEATEPTIEMPARIVAPPLALPPEAGQTGVRVLVATADNALTLLEGKDWQAARKAGEGLAVKRRWDVGGRITAAPFLIGRHVLCVIDRRHLVCLDPQQPERVWRFTAADAIVGQPQLIEGLLIVADQAGRFVGVDPATGKAVGRPYKLTAQVAPAASPAAFGPGQAFAPLTDGTVLLLPLQELRKPAFVYIPVW